jgi:hypothetical protein
MDEIQNCIADAQYGEALRGMDVQRPTERFPVPPTDFDMPAFVKEQGLTRSHALAEPLGLYLFAKVCAVYVARLSAVLFVWCGFPCLRLEMLCVMLPPAVKS